ncbi:MAG: exosortase-associated EpsI family protein [Proteobacteria bacterium]|nr:exosortase-associated EpsI family protein [Pseudomonadota bacterium]
MRASGSQRLWLLFTLACLVAVLYWPSTAILLSQWADFVNITYTHGWLILGVSLGLVVRERGAIAAAPVAPWPLAQAGVLAASLAWLISYRASMEDLQVLIYPSLFWLAASAALGKRIGRLLLFPTAFFVFALPSWGQFADPLQALTVSVMGVVLDLTGPHAVIQGDYIHIPNGSFVIEQGCSGLHFMIVGLAVAALHGELRRDPWQTRALQLLLMAGLALLANWVRVYTVIEAGYLTDMKHHLVSVSHYWFGWGVFAVALAGFFWLSTWFAPSTATAAISAPRAEPAAPASGEWRAVLLAAILLALLPGLSATLRQRSPPDLPDLAELIRPGAPWSFAQGSFDSFWVPEFAGADQTLHTVVTDADGRMVEIFAAGYREQRQGAELVGESSSLLGRHLESRAEGIAEAGADRFIETVAADPEGARSLIWSRYRIGSRPFVRPLASQLWYGLRASLGHVPSTLVAARVECVQDCATARQLLRSMAASGSLP